MNIHGLTLSRFLRNLSIYFFASIALVILLKPLPTLAATCTSSGTGVGWGSPGVWSCGHVPLSTDDAVIGDGSTVTATSTYSAASLTFTGSGSGSGGTGTLTVSSPATLSITTGILVPTASKDGNYTIAGTGAITCATSTIGDLVTPSSALRAFTLNSTITSLSISGNLTLVGSYSSSAGGRFNNPVFSLQTGTVTVGGQIVTSNANAGNTSSFLMTGGAQTGTLKLTGTTPWSLSGTGTNTITLNGTSAVVNYQGTSAQTPGNLPAAKVYSILKINNASGFTLSNTITAATVTVGDVISNSVFSDGGYQISSTGTLNLTSGTFKLDGTGTATTWPTFAIRNISSGTTVEYGSAAAQVVSVTPSYQNLTFSGAGAKTPALGALSIAGNWSATGGTALLNTNNNAVTVVGNIAGTASIAAGTSTISIGGNWTNNGTFTPDSGTVDYNGSGPQTVGAVTYNNLTLSGSGAKTLTGVTTINSNLSMSGSASATTASSLAVGGSVNLSGTSSLIGGAAMTVAGSFTLGATATFVAGAFTHNIAGNWVNNGGTFTRTGSTINLNGSGQSVNGSTTFENFSKQISSADTLTFAAGSTQTVTGALTLTGAPSSTTRLSLRSSTSGTQWMIDPQDGRSVSWVDVKDSNNINATAIPVANSRDSGNNINWSFPVSYSGTVFTDEGSTTMGAGRTVSITVNGGAITSTTTHSDGTYVLDAVAVAGDKIVIYLDGNAEKGSLVSYTAGSESGMDIYQNHLNLRGTTAVTNAHFATASNGDSDILYSASGGNLTIATGTEFYISTGRTFQPGGNVTAEAIDNRGTFNLEANTINLSGDWQTVGTFSVTTGTVNYVNTTGGQVVAGTTYYNLNLSHTTGTQTAGGNIVATTVNNTNAGGILDMSTYTLSATTINNTGTIKTQSTSASSLPSGRTWGGTVEYNASTTQGVIAGTYNHLTFSAAGTKTTPAGTLTVGGDWSVTGGTAALNTNNTSMTVTGNIIGTGAITSGSATTTIGGNWTNSGTFTPGSGTVHYNKAGAQTVGAVTYNHLTFSGSGAKTAANNITVNGILNLSVANPSSTTGLLDMSTYTLNMGGSARTIGTGDVTGIVKRVSFVSGIHYTFGSQYTTIDLQNTGTLPTDISVKIVIGSAPAWRSGAVQRTYDVIQNGSSNSYSELTLHYLDSELNGNAENKLVLWDGHLPAPPGNVEEYGRSNYDLTNSWVTISSVDTSYFTSSFDTQLWTLDESELPNATWNGSVDTDWVNADNWTPNGVPSDLTDVVIPDAGTTPNDPTLGETLLVGRLTLEASAILNSAVSSSVAISGSAGAWSNNGGLFNAGTSTVIFTSATATYSGETSFYNVVIGSGFGLTLESDSVMRIGGMITNNGTWSVAEGAGSTVEYNGANQTVLNPNGLTAGYRTLILSGSGTKTMPATSLSVLDDFSVTGTASVTANNVITTEQGVSIGSGATFTAGAFTHEIGGDFTNNGTFVGTGSTITFNDHQMQYIGGTVETVFDNVVITNATSTVVAANNFSVVGTMTVTSGSRFYTDSYVVSGVGTFTLASGGTLGIGSTDGITSSGGTGNIQTTTRNFSTGGNYIYNGTANQVTGNGLPATVNDLTVNNTGGSGNNTVTLGGIKTVDGVLDLVAGNLATGANNIYISSSGSVSGGSTDSHVVGNLRKYIATGATSKTFEIGDATNYTPVSVQFGNVTVAGDLTESSTSGDHPNIGTSSINASKSVNRYWSATSTGMIFDDYSIIFNFINPGDLDGGANTSNFIVGKYSGGSWSYPTVGTKNSSDTQATGLTGFSDFQLGELGDLIAPVIAITAPTHVSGTAITNTTIQVTDDIAIASTTVSLAGSTAGTSNFNCVQTSGTIVNCTLSITSSGNLAVSATDVASNATSTSELGYIIDAVLPVVTITAPTHVSSTAIYDTTIRVTDNVGVASSTVNLAGSTAGTSGLSCTQTSGTQVDCTLSITSSGDLTVNATDNALNVGTSTETGYTITLDTTAPVVTITAPSHLYRTTITDTTFRITDNIGLASSTVSVAGSSVGTSDLDCTQTSAAQVDCTIFITSSGDLVVSATDYASNVGSSTEVGYIIDTVLPVVTITAPTHVSSTTIYDTTIRVTDNIGVASSTLNLTGTTAGTSDFSCTQTSSTQVDCTISIISNGDLTVNATDSALNYNSSTEAGYTVTGDIIKPVISVTAPTHVSSTAITNTTIQVTDDTAIASSTVSLAGSTAGTSNFNCVQTSGTIVNCTLSITSSGNLAVSATDAASNATSTSELGYIIDAVLPVVAITAPTHVSSTAIYDTTIRVTDNIGVASSTVNLAGSTAGTSGLSCTQTSGTQVDCTISITSDGDLTVNATDNATNFGTATESGYTITGDITAPAVTITAPTHVSSSAINDTTIQITDDMGVASSTVNVSGSTAGTSGLSCTQTNALQVDCTISITSSGDLTVNATDDASNPGTATEIGYTITIDVTAPTVTITAPTHVSSTAIINTGIQVTDDIGVASSTVNLTGTTAGNSGFSCIQTNATQVDCTINITSSGDLTVNAMDNASNPGTATEIGYIIDAVVPVVAITAPTHSSSSAITNTTIRVTDNRSVLNSSVSVSGSATPTGLSCTQTSATQVDCTVNITTSGTLLVDAMDAAGNPAVQGSEAGYTITDATAPALSAISATPHASSGDVSWTTDELASSKVIYSPDTSYASSTSEGDTAPRVLSHAVTVSNLKSCTTYHYEVISRDAAGNSSTSTDRTFITTDCVGGATVTGNIETVVATSTGATESLAIGTQAIDVTLPPGFTSTSSQIVLQIKSLTGNTVILSLGKPTGYTDVGDSVFDVKALIDAATLLDSFAVPVTIVFHYSDADVSGINESTLKIYRYDGSGWIELDSCVNDAAANTITCTTPRFSVFALFGQTQVTHTNTSFGGGGLVSAPSTVKPVYGDTALSLTLDHVDYLADGTAKVWVWIKLNADPSTVRGYALSTDSAFTNANLNDYRSLAYIVVPENPNVVTIYGRYYSTNGHPSNTLSLTVDLLASKTGTLDPSSLPALASSLQSGFGKTCDQSLADLVLKQVYADAKEFKMVLTVDQATAVRNFILCGNSSATIKFGLGERRAIVRDYMDTVNRSAFVWADIERISTGQIPLARNLTRERQQVITALPAFRKMFGHAPVFTNAAENLAWNTLMYRIRFSRDLVREAKGVKGFSGLYGHKPVSPFAWSIVRVLGYVK